MTGTWRDHGYQEVLTADGSPSLKYGLSEAGEGMHHSGGAWSETRQIYGRLIGPVLALEKPRFLSLGLGLGYNEILIADEGLRQERDNWFCVSYEADPFLSRSLLAFLRGEGLGERQNTYDRILSGVAEPGLVREALLRAHREQRWILQEALTPQTRAPFPVHGFLWDAFSQKTSPPLWSEEFLTVFLEETADSQAAGLSTYACIGSLKRALRKNGFTVRIEPGFQGKRHSTLAWRGFEG